MVALNQTPVTLLAPLTGNIETSSSAKLLFPVRDNFWTCSISLLTESDGSVKLTSIPVGMSAYKGTVVFFGVREFQSQDCWLKTRKLNYHL